MKKGKLLNLEKDVIKDLSNQGIDLGYTNGVKQYMEDILTDVAANNKNKIPSDQNVYHTIIESLIHVVWVATKDGKATYLNKAWTDWTGRSVDESLGHNWISSIHPDDISDQVLKWEKAYKNGERYHGECRFVHISGNITHCAYTGIPVKDSEGKITNWIGIDLDITARKGTEMELKNKVAQLTSMNKVLESRDKELKRVESLLEELKQNAIKNN